MATRDELLAAGLRHDPQRPRQSVRQGREKGLRVFIAAAELRAAGLDPDDPAPAFRVWADPNRRGSLLLRFYR